MTSDHGQTAQTFASIGIDIGKDVFHIVGFDLQGKVVLRKKFKRLALEGELASCRRTSSGSRHARYGYSSSRALDKRALATKRENRTVVG